ncbi:MAG: transporter substrate-binding domain-containing protein [Burkholderiales bacterium]|nr:transporter substrate-binding domain-containing protein [Burkholderiales bacterium]
MKNLFIAILLCTVLTARADAPVLEAVTQDYPPMSYIEGDRVTGFSTDILHAMAAQAGLHTHIAVLPWARAYQTALSQPDTLIYTITRIPERENLFEWIGPITPRRIFLFKLRERKDIQIKSAADVYHYKVGLVREMATSKIALQKKILDENKIDFAPTPESNLKKLFLGRVDLIVTLDWNAYYQARQLGYSADQIEPALLIDDTIDYYFALSKHSDPALLQKLRAAWEHVKASGQVETLRTRYLN